MQCVIYDEGSQSGLEMDSLYSSLSGALPCPEEIPFKKHTLQHLPTCPLACAHHRSHLSRTAVASAPLFNKLLDPSASAEFPPAHKVDKRALDNRELDKLVANLGRNKSTWRRALQLHEWLLGLGPAPDDRCVPDLLFRQQTAHNLWAC